MPDILIRGMEMPERCDEKCPLYNTGCGYFDCVITKRSYNWGLPGRPSDCPLVELPEHGDLVDRSELQNTVMQVITKFPTDNIAAIQHLDLVNALLRGATVIIPSNREETE